MRRFPTFQSLQRRLLDDAEGQQHSRDTHELTRFCLLAPFVVAAAVAVIAGLGWLIAYHLPTLAALAPALIVAVVGAIVLPGCDWKDGF